MVDKSINLTGYTAVKVPISIGEYNSNKYINFYIWYTYTVEHESGLKELRHCSALQAIGYDPESVLNSSGLSIAVCGLSEIQVDKTSPLKDIFDKHLKFGKLMVPIITYNGDELCKHISELNEDNCKSIEINTVEEAEQFEKFLSSSITDFDLFLSQYLSAKEISYYNLYEMVHSPDTGVDYNNSNDWGMSSVRALSFDGKLSLDTPYSGYNTDIQDNDLSNNIVLTAPIKFPCSEFNLNSVRILDKSDVLLNLQWDKEGAMVNEVNLAIECNASTCGLYILPYGLIDESSDEVYCSQLDYGNYNQDELFEFDGFKMAYNDNLKIDYYIPEFGTIEESKSNASIISDYPSKPKGYYHSGSLLDEMSKPTLERMPKNKSVHQFPLRLSDKFYGTVGIRTSSGQQGIITKVNYYYLVNSTGDSVLLIRNNTEISKSSLEVISIHEFNNRFDINFILDSIKPKYVSRAGDVNRNLKNYTIKYVQHKGKYMSIYDDVDFISYVESCIIDVRHALNSLGKITELEYNTLENSITSGNDLSNNDVECSLTELTNIYRYYLETEINNVHKSIIIPFTLFYDIMRIKSYSEIDNLELRDKIYADCGYQLFGITLDEYTDFINSLADKKRYARPNYMDRANKSRVHDGVKVQDIQQFLVFVKEKIHNTVLTLLGVGIDKTVG